MAGKMLYLTALAAHRISLQQSSTAINQNRRQAIVTERYAVELNATSNGLQRSSYLE